MLQPKIAVLWIGLVLGISSCNRTTNTISLTGEWSLQVPKGCDYGDVRSDRLVLQPDGTMEQYIEFVDGSTYSSKIEHWQQLSAKDISLQKRMNVPIKGSREKRGEILILESTNPPIILLDPDKNCFY